MPMQIVERSGEGLSRVFGVTVPAQDLQAKLEARVVEIRPQLNLKGFRPGKVPAAHVKRMYGKSLMGEIVEQTMNEGQQQALSEAKLRPAAAPDVKVESDIDKVLAGQSDLAFELAMDVMPDFDPVDVATIELTRPVHAPAEEEVDAQVDEIASQNRTYEAKDGPAEDGDMVVADFLGRIDGEAFEGGAAEDAEIVVGSNRFIPGFEEQLLGAKAGDAVTVSVTFPAEYGAQHLAGKPAEFAVTVKAVRSPASGGADDAFAARIGFENLEKLRDAVRAQIAQQYAGASRYKAKRALLDVLDKGHDFPLPPRMVDSEFNVIWQQVEAERAQDELSPEDQGKTDEQLRAEYRKIAERRVRLGLVLAEIGQRNNVQITDQEMNTALAAEARRYPGQEKEIFEFYRKNAQASAQLRAPLYEEKVVDLILGRAKVADEQVSKEELFKEDEMPEGYEESGSEPKAVASASADATSGEETVKAAKPRAKAKVKPGADDVGAEEAAPIEAAAEPGSFEAAATKPKKPRASKPKTLAEDKPAE